VILTEYQRVGKGSDIWKCLLIHFLRSPYVIGQTIIFSSCGFYLLSSFFPRLISAVGDWILPYFGTWCGPSVNLECRSGTCCTRLAANAGPKKSPKNRHLGTIAQLCRVISLRNSGTYQQSEKSLLSSDISTCLHNMVNFGPLTAEIDSTVWGTPANFNWFRVLAALLHGI